MEYHNHMKFSTYDRDQDIIDKHNCAKERDNVGWWYNACHYVCMIYKIIEFVTIVVN